MGTARALVVGSGRCPAWICSVSNSGSLKILVHELNQRAWAYLLVERTSHGGKMQDVWEVAPIRPILYALHIDTDRFSCNLIVTRVQPNLL